MAKGDKYVIEIEEKMVCADKNGQAYPLYKVKGFNTLVFDEYGIKRLKKLNNYNVAKYQKSLDMIKGYIESWTEKVNEGSDLDNNFNVINDLIENMNFVESVQTPDYERVQKELWSLQKEFNKLKEEYEHKVKAYNSCFTYAVKLNNALDKACEIIADKGLSFSIYQNDKCEWKYHLLKETEDE